MTEKYGEIRTEAKEYEASEQIRAIMDNINGGVTATILKSEVPQFLFANDQYFAQLGYTREQFMAEVSSAFALVHPEDRDRVMEQTLQASATCQPFSCIYRVIRRDGSVAWIKSNISITMLPGIDKPVQLAVANDISKEKEAERKIIEASEQLLFLNDTANDLLIQTDDAKGIENILQKILDYFDGSHASVYIFDYTGGMCRNICEVCACGFAASAAEQLCFPLETVWFWINSLRDSRLLYIDNVMDLGFQRQGEYGLLQKMGSRSLLAVALRSAEEVVGMMGVFDPGKHLDSFDNLGALGNYMAAILARRSLNAKIKSDNQMLKTMMNDTPGGFVRLQLEPDKAVVPIYINDGFCKLVGMTHAEIMDLYGDTVLAGVHPGDVPSLSLAAQEMLINGGMLNSKLRLQHGKYGYVWLMIFGRLIRNGTDTSFLNLYFTDMSEQIQKEIYFQEMLPVALSAIMESSSDISFMKDKDLNYLGCSRAFAQLLGFENVRDIVGKSGADLFPHELAARFRADDLKLLQGGGSLIDYVEPVMAADGSMRYLSISKYRLNDIAGNALGLYGTGRDITENRITYTQLQLLTDSIPGGLAIYECSADNIKLVYFNDGFHRYSGYEREEYARLAAEDPLFLVFQEDVAGFRQQFNDLLQHDVQIDYFYRIHTKKGGLCWQNLKGAASERHADKVVINVVLFDVTEQKEAEERLRISEEEMRLAMAQMGKMICLYDIAAHMLTMPPKYAAKYGYTSVMTGMPELVQASDRFDAESRQRFMEFYDAILRGEKKGAADIHSRCVDGSWCWERIEFVSIFGHDGKPVKTIISVEDITEQYKIGAENAVLRESEQVFRTVAAQSSRLVFRYDIESKIVFADSADGALHQAEVVAVNMPDNFIAKGIILPESLDDYRRVFAEINAGNSNGGAELHMLDEAQVARWLDMRYSLIYSEEHTPKSAVISLLDITAEKQAVLEVQKLAETDGMTGLFNKTRTEELISARLSRADGLPCSLMIADLDNLKVINDTLGHPQGDQAICALAEVLQKQFRQTDIIGRIGGDEFIVFLEGVADKSILQKIMMSLIDKISAVKIGTDNNIFLCASIGVTLGIAGEATFGEMYRQADQALYKAKRNGKNQYYFYVPELK